MLINKQRQLLMIPGLYLRTGSAIGSDRGMVKVRQAGAPTLQRQSVPTGLQLVEAVWLDVRCPSEIPCSGQLECAEDGFFSRAAR
jgi:hypothetical protein